MSILAKKTKNQKKPSPPPRRSARTRLSQVRKAPQFALKSVVIFQQ